MSRHFMRYLLYWLQSLLLSVDSITEMGSMLVRKAIYRISVKQNSVLNYCFILCCFYPETRFLLPLIKIVKTLGRSRSLAR